MPDTEFFTCIIYSMLTSLRALSHLILTTLKTGIIIILVLQMRNLRLIYLPQVVASHYTYLGSKISLSVLPVIDFPIYQSAAPLS